MEFLEFQLSEPITFCLYSLSASSTSGSLLTWIAVLAAAAVGFWRIKAVGSKSDESDSSTLFATPSSEEVQKKVVPVVQNVDTEKSVSPSCSFNKSSEIVGTPKERFMTYFEKEDCIGCCHVEEEEEEEPTVDIDEDFIDHREVELPREREALELKWGSIVVRGRRDLGWYSYQDMAALNGSVVRLWNGDSPRRRKGSIAISTC